MALCDNGSSLYHTKSTFLKPLMKKIFKNIVGKENKRAMMALNRSPKSVSPQNEFYLLYYYCSNL